MNNARLPLVCSIALIFAIYNIYIHYIHPTIHVVYDITADRNTSADMFYVNCIFISLYPLVNNVYMFCQINI